MFVTTFDGSRNGMSGDCGAGVKGESFMTLFCMPYGQCNTGSILLIG
jgi:type IV pilus assembly protein PilY1